MKKLKILLWSVFFSCGFSSLFATGVERYAIYVGCNDGGKDRQQLLYAGSDAMNFKRTMADVGGISESNSFILIDPSKKEINNAIEMISARIEKNQNPAVRTEFVFYYSGHSDEEALLLGESKYDYSTLKQTITDIPSDIHVVILDSCYSGNFIRTKGGQKKKPFLVDDSSVVKGHAYLSSSSETESSQESDEIGASYFTNSVIAGLRGAADASGDKKVTLTELYSYAFSETLKNTEAANAGPQHPNYNITLVGSGDLVLSDFSNSDSIISISAPVEGRVIFRDSNGVLISEINKTENIPVMLAMPAGHYSVAVIGKNAFQGEFDLKKDEAFVLEESALSKMNRKATVSRGPGARDFEDEHDNLSEREEKHAEHRERKLVLVEEDEMKIKITTGKAEIKLQVPSKKAIKNTFNDFSLDEFIDEELLGISDLDDEFDDAERRKEEKRKSKQEKKEKKTENDLGFFEEFNEERKQVKTTKGKVASEISWKLVPYIGQGIYSDQYYLRDDMTLPSVAPVIFEYRGGVKIGESVSFFWGSGLEFDIMKTGGNDSDFGFQFALQPCLGVYINPFNNYALDGFGIAFYPVYNFGLGINVPKSYYDWQSAIEVDIETLIYKNMNFGFYVRACQFWKDTQVAFDASVGFIWGIKWPQKNL